jgi:hypothetical protein
MDRKLIKTDSQKKLPSSWKSLCMPPLYCITTSIGIVAAITSMQRQADIKAEMIS